MNNTIYKQTEIGKIPEDWDIKPIGMVMDNFDNLRKPLSLMERLKIKGRYPYYGAASVIDYINNYIYDGEYLLIAEDGTVVVDGNKPMLQLANGKFWVSNHSHVLKGADSFETKFVYYQLQNTNILPFVTGAVQAKLNQENLNSIPVFFPRSKTERKTIVEFITSIDDKIELNKKMNKTLEEIGEALFKRWFVDFEFPNDDGKPYRSSGGSMRDSEWGEIPEGWEIKPLDAIATFLNGVACQKYPPKDEAGLPVIKIGELHNGITENSDRATSSITSEYIIEDGDVLFSWSGSLEIVLWSGGRGVLNQHLFKVNSENFPKWFYYQWVLKFLPFFREIASNKVTTMGHIQRSHIAESLVLVPKKTILEKIDSVMAPLLDKIVANSIEIKSLAQIRDSLLPRLMSGKLRVN